MRTQSRLLQLTVLALVSTCVADAWAAPDEGDSALRSGLQQRLDLARKRAPGTYYFDMVSTFTTITPNGSSGPSETFRMKLKCVSPADATIAGDQCTCRRFVYIDPAGTSLKIPSLDGWTYTFKMPDSGTDEQGQVFGINHAKFRDLKDERGDPLAPAKAYLIYNTFIDFHGFCDHLGSPTTEGKGIQDLTHIGQRIVHSSANTKPPTNVVGVIKKGSYFQNGEITLFLKGLSLIDDSVCAVVEFDSGTSSFRMLMEPAPGVQVKTVGGSHYFGDIYVDLASGRPRKVALRELIVCETKVPVPGSKKRNAVPSVQERQTSIASVTKEAYELD